MRYINLDSLNEQLNSLRVEFIGREPFRFIVLDDFLYSDAAEFLLKAYPETSEGVWDHTTYIDQQNKFQKTRFKEGDIFDQVFRELNSAAFLAWLQQLTTIEEPLVADDLLFGGGLHQSTNGAFLNVHVDYNVHPIIKHHRRLNVMVYLNKNWQANYGGYLELWDLTEGKSQLMDSIAPAFNRCVIFETNEVSYHGHPKKLNVPDGITRKSLATYYYTQTRPISEQVPEHNTIFVNTEGLSGQVKRFKSGVKAALERINKQK
ncbi:2OG-Fe(II) oxygenase [Pontibacter sp. BT310]|uniref:2OG-Fe(II) oxygenase n=1 Tax=Pontibacter populi TaxID=890055 RepID=A0ABS6XGQ8_9BACT|nr:MULTISPECIES: 2OG-Fe(II) oxygenase [Pontibacter]MBJ6119996.1 2OG-Fe(II) oxygenase [Pontibacter sp. BT310]MBR0572425.1 2OG-Fe(II) oxygenase [Microvirga sp. STS03]MBW3366849.1 2OG-Fe(II) oxygenase [Pontibacter populi]